MTGPYLRRRNVTKPIKRHKELLETSDSEQNGLEVATFFTLVIAFGGTLESFFNTMCVTIFKMHSISESRWLPYPSNAITDLLERLCVEQNRLGVARFFTLVITLGGNQPAMNASFGMRYGIIIANLVSVRRGLLQTANHWHC